jgi:putative endonuclease
MEKQFYVYIMTNWNNTVLYTGVTSNLLARIFQHKLKLNPGFTEKYKIKKLIYYEEIADALSAIAREKQIKGGSRADKVKLVNKMNALWSDLSEQP